MTQSFIKDPQSILDYTVDWATWLVSDTISTSTWTVPTGLTKVIDSKTTTTATVWLSGGTVGQIHEVTNEIVTAGGRTDDRTIIIAVQQK